MKAIIKPLLGNGKKVLANGADVVAKNVINGNGNGSLVKSYAKEQRALAKANTSTFVPEDTVVDLSYKPSDNFVKAERQKRIDTSPIYTWNTIKDTKITSLDEVTEWNSEFKPGTKEHFKDFGLAMKYMFPDKEGGDAFVGFEDIYKKYEELGFSRKIDGETYRLKRTSINGPKHKFANGPALSAQPQSQRNITNARAGAKRTQNIVANGFSSPEDKANFSRLNKEKAQLNIQMGRKGKTGTGGYVLEHDILQSSRYWKVHTHRKNSDSFNVYNWNNTKWITYKGAVERHIKRLTGEPFAVKMNGTKDTLEIIHIDTDKVIGTLDLNADYKELFKRLQQDFA
tara:strand:+ start:1251 stop:2276 length:1026 start_codon:yes stop_codon:yes gene_type:complete